MDKELIKITTSIGRMEAKIEELGRDVKEIKRDISGNGQKGLKNYVSEHESRLSVLEEKHNSYDKHTDWSIRKAAILIGVTVTIITTTVSIVVANIMR